MFNDQGICESCLSPMIEKQMYCPICNALQKPQDNYFKLLDLPIIFAINLEELEENYLRLQSRVHPDKFINSENEKMTAMIYSSKLNQAYITLKDPYLRACYLLEFNGVDLPEKRGESTINDHELLTQMMTLNQQIMGLSNVGECVKLGQEITDEMAKIYQEIVLLFDQQDFKQARSKVHHWRYLQKNITRIKERQRGVK